MGVYLRGKGVYSHVTYIDEILILTKGELFENPENTAPEPLLSYVYKTAVSPSNSYAPLGAFLGRLIVGPAMFSLRGLKVLRFISFVFSTLALFLFAWLFFCFSEKKITGALLLIVSVFACQMGQWVNAKQGHSYAAGVFSLVLTLEMLRWTLLRPTTVRTLALLFSCLVLGFSQYQILIFNVALSIAVLTYSIPLRHQRSDPTIGLLVKFSISLLVTTLLVLGFVVKLKGHLMTPYWVGGYYNSQILLLKQIEGFLKNLFEVFSFAHLFYTNGENGVVATVGIIASVLGVLKLLCWEKPRNVFMLICFRAMVIFLFVWFFAFWFGKTPMAPTRHCLIYLIPFLFLEFQGFRQIESRFKSKSIGFVLAFLSVVVVWQSLRNFPAYLKASEETFISSKITFFANKYNVMTVTSDPFDHSKLKLFSQGYFDEYALKPTSRGYIDNLPAVPTLFIEMNSSGEFIGPPFEKVSQKFSLELLFVSNTGFDFEPSKHFIYGVNLFKIWLLRPKNELKKL